LNSQRHRSHIGAEGPVWMNNFLGFLALNGLSLINRLLGPTEERPEHGARGPELRVMAADTLCYAPSTREERDAR